MEAISAITQRISEIQTRMGATAPIPAAIASLQASTTTSTATAATLAATSTLDGTSSLVSGLTGATGSTATTFADLLAASTTGLDPLASAAALLNSDGVPVALAGYGNGLIPEEALSPIAGSTERLWTPAAEQLDQLIADAAADGISIGVTDGYRDYDAQVAVAASKGLYLNGGLAAVPGTSQHGWGLAADLDLDADALAWMRAHAREYGFVEAVDREPWHWEFQPAA
ncbi:M15 family metallopeptidase [Demequina mangrovi]|uniref:D-alanyl-D-alanine carboxypeptidase n=1 Tax=Demequina mangrovi TaxID=1043493 RepID=A0A1H6ZTK4_9MICO|nr:M15 family metallopeptidase [Demequina mangrovi]SEJ55524.1 D-alanyl-D-alanine carboxypeptidase [Demequina mangrovi]